MNYSQTLRYGENLLQVFLFRVELIQRDVFPFLTQNVILVRRQHREHMLEESWQRDSGADSELRQVEQQRCPDTSGNGSFCRRVDHQYGIVPNTLRI